MRWAMAPRGWLTRMPSASAGRAVSRGRTTGSRRRPGARWRRRRGRGARRTTRPPRSYPPLTQPALTRPALTRLALRRLALTRLALSRRWPASGGRSPARTRSAGRGRSRGPGRGRRPSAPAARAGRTAGSGRCARIPGRGSGRGADPPGGARVSWSARQPPISAYVPDHMRPSPDPAADIKGSHRTMQLRAHHPYQASTLDDRHPPRGELANVVAGRGLAGRGPAGQS
jgi:hypothetical protein